MTLGQYRLEEKIGVGGMGEVFRAVDTKLERKVALKFLPEALRSDPEARLRLLREAKAASKLNHKNILTVHAVDEVDGHDFIVMEYIDGRMLDELITDGSLTTEQVVRIAMHVADGLMTAHQAGVIHRDIKPSNIIVTKQGQAKIMDFGLATWQGAAKLTREGSTLGTVAYSSPEQVQGRELDGRSDIFSLGAVIYQMITGQMPFPGEHQAAIVYSIVNEAPKPIADIKPGTPPGLQTIVAKALQKDPDKRYQSATEMLTDLKQEKHALNPSVISGPTPVPTPTPKKGILSPLTITAGAIVVLALILLILKPWRLEISSDQPAAAAVEDRLAVMYFENMAEPGDPKRLGEIAANLLITDLSESQFIQVVSSQRLYDILKALNMEGTKVIDKGVATQVAEKAGARWMLTGSILQVEPNIVMTTQLVDVKTGNAIASQQVTGQSGKTIFDLIDQLTVEIKGDLSLPQDAAGERDPEVADITTGSWDAYSLYLAGMDYFYQYKFTKAEENFRKAIAIDSTFAMAYYGLSMVRSITQMEQFDAINRAYEYIDRASHKEQEFIRAQYAIYHRNDDEALKHLEGIAAQYPDEKEAYFRIARLYQPYAHPQKTIAALQKAIAADSLFKDAYNVLAYQYEAVGEWESALWAINKYISLAPDEPNVYDSQGDLYSRHGDIDAAIASYRKALDLDSLYVISLENLGRRYVMIGDYAAAQQVCDRLIAHPDKNARSLGREILAMIPMRQGSFKQALRALDYGLETDRVESCLPINITIKLFLRARIGNQIADYRNAIIDAEACAKLIDEADPYDPFAHAARGLVAVIYANAGDTLKADSIATGLMTRFASADSIWPQPFWGMRGWYEYARHNYEAAIRAFTKSITYPSFTGWYGLAISYHKARRLADAVRAYERALQMYDDSRRGPFAVLIHYNLGVAYEESGWNDRAISQYETFLDIWKNADPGIREIADAKARLKKLRSASS